MTSKQQLIKVIRDFNKSFPHAKYCAKRKDIHVCDCGVDDHRVFIETQFAKYIND